MQQTQADPLVDALVKDFGGNYVFALDILEQYRSNPQSVDASWREYFDRLLGVAPKPEPPPPPNGPAWTAAGRPRRPHPTPRRPQAGGGNARPPARCRGQAAALAREKSKALAVPAILPGDIAQPIRGGALRIVENMEASLTVPTATSMRSIPVRTLEENRRILNKHRDAHRRRARSLHAPRRLGHRARARRRSRASTTPTRSWTARPHRIQRDKVRLGIAVDVAEEGRLAHAARPEHQGRRRAWTSRSS